MNKVKHWLEEAVKFEEKGHDFYAAMAQKAHDSALKDFFSDMAEQEKAHIKSIKKIYDQVKKNNAWPKDAGADMSSAGLDALIKKIKSKLAKAANKAEAGLVEAIDQAINLESDAQVFYNKESQEASSTAEKEFLKKLAGEENSHRMALVDLKLYYTDPAAWHEQAARIGLDGA